MISATMGLIASSQLVEFFPASGKFAWITEALQVNELESLEPSGTENELLA